MADNKQGINQINQLLEENKRLNAQIASLTRELDTKSQQNEDLREWYTKERAKRLGTLAQASEAMARAKELEEQLKASTSRKKMHEAEAKAEALETQNVELQVRLEEEIAIKQDVINQLRNIITATDARAMRKWIENKNKKIRELEKSGKRAEALVISQQKEITDLKGELEEAGKVIDNLMDNLQKAESQGWINDVKLIFKGFGINYGVTLEKGERQDLYMKVRAAKKLDKSSSKKDQGKKETKGFDAIIKKIVKDIKETRVTQAGKAMITEEFVIGLLNQAMDKPSLARAFAKSPLKVKLASVAVVVALISSIAVASVGWGKTDKRLTGANDDLIQASQTISEQGLELEVKDVLGDIGGYYRTLKTNNDYMTLFTDKDTDIAEYVRGVTTQFNNASGIVAYSDSGEIDENSKLGIAVSEYNNGDKDKIETIQGYSDDMKGYAESSEQSIEKILSARGLTEVELDEDYKKYLDNKTEIDTAVEVLAQPVISFEIDDELIARYNEEFTSSSLGGKVKEVKSATYDRDSGKVKLLVDCTGRFGDYINYVTYNMDSKLISVTAEGVLSEAIKNATLTSTIGYSSTALSDANGNTIYVSSNSISSDSSSTEIGLQVLVVTEAGEVKTYSSKQTVEGVFKKSSEKYQTVYDELYAGLLDRVNNQLGTEFDISGDEIDME